MRRRVYDKIILRKKMQKRSRIKQMMRKNNNNEHHKKALQNSFWRYQKILQDHINYDKKTFEE